MLFSCGCGHQHNDWWLHIPKTKGLRRAQYEHQPSFSVSVKHRSSQLEKRRQAWSSSHPTPTFGIWETKTEKFELASLMISCRAVEPDTHESMAIDRQWHRQLVAVLINHKNDQPLDPGAIVIAVSEPESIQLWKQTEECEGWNVFMICPWYARCAFIVPLFHMFTASQEQKQSLKVSMLKELPKPNSHRNNAMGDFLQRTHNCSEQDQTRCR